MKIARPQRRSGWTKSATGLLPVLLVVGWCAGPATAAGIEATWGAVKQLGGVSTVTVGVPSSAAPTMTCWSPGNCVAVGTYLDHINRSRVFVQDEVNGAWKPARSATGTDAQAGGALSRRCHAVDQATASASAASAEPPSLKRR